MPTVSQLISLRQRRAQLARRNPLGRLGLLLSAIISIFLTLVTVASAFVYIDISQDLPSLSTLPSLIEPPGGLLLQPSRLVDRSGEHILLTLENPAAAGKEYLYLSPEEDRPVFASALISATLATTDPDFWEHPGYSLEGITTGSHPTLAQRLITDLVLWEEPPGIRRALRERLLAAQATSAYGREKILEWYLNTANYGAQAYGADAAARVYFGKSAADLDLAEAALLAGLAQAPALNPLEAPQAAVENQQQVLDQMVLGGFITPEQASAALNARLSIRPPVQAADNPAPAFTSLVLAQLETEIERSRLERGGLTIVTSLDYDLQRQVNCAAQAQLARLEPGSSSGHLAGGIQDCPAALLLPTLPAQSTPLPSNLSANVVVLDPQTGEILALYGNPSDSPEIFARRPAGSLLTPFVYLTAFTRGMSPATLVWDIPSEFRQAPVANFDGQYHGPIRLRQALANDYLVPALDILAQVGPGNVWRTSQQTGLTGVELPNSDTDLLLPFTSGTTTVLEAARAFGIFANQGFLVGGSLGAESTSQNPDLPLEPLIVHRVLDGAGHTLLENPPGSSRQVIGQPLAFLLNHSLSDESARWPSLGHPNPLEIGRPTAAKIGRTLDGQDAWAVGYTPQRVVSVWIGPQSPAFDLEQETADASETRLPPNAAAALWHAIIQYASQSLPPAGWDMPPGVSQVTVCDPSGMLPTPECPALVTEVFLQGNEPTQADTLYQRLPVNRETGRLATVFTPGDLIEERIYLVPPSEASDWAQAAGISIPPQEYDVVPTNMASNPDASLSSPAMFAYVRGSVVLRGRAGGENFSFYRVQVGKGLNPDEWVLLGEDRTTPVEDNQLAVWDTSGINGLYTVQLMVVDQDQRIQKAFLLLSVDNTQPEAEMLYPRPAQVIQPEKRFITLRLSASDDIALQEVRLFIDGELAETFIQPPYALSWRARPGEHTVRIVAIDKAGNQTETESEFTIR